MSVGRMLTYSLVVFSIGMVMAVTATSASASALSLNCDVTGTAAATVPNVGTPSNNTYTFNSLTFKCNGSIDGVADTWTIDASSTGTFQNSICGTGSATSSSVSINSVSGAVTGPRSPPSNDFSYLIDFSGTVGQLTWRASDAQNPGGVVQITPDYVDFPAPPLGGTTCANGFTVHGVLHYDNTGGGGGSADVPSSTCQRDGGSNAIGQPVFPRDVLGVATVSAFVWPESNTKVHVCVRVQSGTTAAGGRLDVDDSGGGGLSPVVSTDQPDTSPNPPCDQEITQGPSDHVYITKVDANTRVISMCVLEAGANKRIDVGVSGSASPPLVHWTHDPDGPGTDF